MTGRCAHTQTDKHTHIERTHYLRHSLRSLGGDNHPSLFVCVCPGQALQVLVQVHSGRKCSRVLCQVEHRATVLHRVLPANV